ncbi:transmembrane protein 14C [Sporodiniella umbellata]|nr:transmembrane protein 14C [Sporodiniella umbellata]
MSDVLGYSYGAIVFAGGLIGFFKAGSVPSLAAGALFGGLASLGAYQVSQDAQNVALGLGVSLVLLVVMGARFYRGRKVMPAGLVSLLSLLMVIRYTARLL